MPKTRRCLFILFLFGTFMVRFYLADAVAAPTLAGCTVFPPDNIWNTPVDDLPVDARSQSYIASMGEDTGLHADFGSGTWNGGPIGIPITLVNNSQAPVTVRLIMRMKVIPAPTPFLMMPPLREAIRPMATAMSWS